MASQPSPDEYDYREEGCMWKIKADYQMKES